VDCRVLTPVTVVVVVLDMRTSDSAESCLGSTALERESKVPCVTDSEVDEASSWVESLLVSKIDEPPNERLENSNSDKRVP
jgi:hypothetical protein